MGTQHDGLHADHIQLRFPGALLLSRRSLPHGGDPCGSMV